MGRLKIRFFRFQYCGLVALAALAALAPLAACTPSPPAVATAFSGGSAGEAALLPASTQVTAPTLRPSRTPAATQLVAAQPAAAPAPGGQPASAAPVCAPFPDYSQAELLAAISNPYNPPPPGSDDPHQAIDLAVVQDGMALAGGSVQAVLGGRVAMATGDRFPYGYAVLIETSLDNLPSDWLPEAARPTLAPTLPPHPVLTCPAVDAPAAVSAGRSLYLLYAHLAESPALKANDRVACGDPLGKIGQTGNALNPHLHLEARLGPPGWSFASMAHYDSTAVSEEMGAYCLWRVSNLYQLVDPRTILARLP